MNPILHQWKWDFRHIRTLWFFWILLLAASSLGSQFATGSRGPEAGLASILSTVNAVSVYLFGILLVTRIMYSTPFAGTSAFWKTRPMAQTSLFWSKTLLIVSVIFLPVLLVQILGWRLQNLGGSFLFWGSLYYGALTLSIFILAAAWAALCERFGSFCLAFAGTGGVLAVFVITFVQISERLEFLPFQSASAPDSGHSVTANSSTLIAMMLAFLIAVVMAWFLGARWKHRPAALSAIFVGIVFSASANSVWKLDYLRSILAIPDSEGALPQTDLDSEVVVLGAGQAASEDLQLFCRQVGVKLPKGQTLNLDSWQFSFGPGPLPLKNKDNSANWSEWIGNHQQRLKGFYPTGTRLIGTKAPQYDEVILSEQVGATGTLSGRAEATLYEWKPLYSVPLRPGATTKISGYGLARLGGFDGSNLQLSEVRPPAPFRPSLWSNLDSRSHTDGHVVFVLYHEKLNTALVANGRVRPGPLGGSLAARRESYTIEFDAQRLHALTGSGSLQQAADSDALRLDAYEAIAIGVTQLQFEQKNWIAHRGSREGSEGTGRLIPTITRTALPDNPTGEQVDAYLDGILFTWSGEGGRQEWQKTEADLQAIGSEHLDRLLARMPVGEYADSIVTRAIQNLLKEHHMPALLAALERDPGLAWHFLQRGWLAEAAPVLARRLAMHRPLDYQSCVPVVRIVASQADPATYDDLRWHFLHAGHSHRAMANALAECPGFPLDEVIAETWASYRYTRVQGVREQLAGLAARLGDKEALRIAFVHYATTENQEDLQLLAKAVEHPGGGDQLAQWVHANFEALTYDPMTKRFALR